MVSLTDPLPVKSFVLRNRVVMPPMASGLASEDGGVTEALIKHYSDRALCNSMVIVEHSYISSDGRASSRQLGIWSDHLIFGLGILARTIRNGGAIAVIQLNHAGGRADPKVCSCIPMAPSPILVPRGYIQAREMNIDDIERILNNFIKAAERAVRAGFDGVEIHGAHGFLLNQFLSPITNRRLDEFGGSLENRMRFPLMVVEGVRRVTKNKLLLYRLGADDLIEGGFTIEEAIKVATKLVDYGIDIIDVSGGLCGSSPQHLQGTQGYFIPLAEKIRRHVDVPVIGVGGINNPCIANRFISDGRVDLVAVGRAQLADHLWTCKAVREINRCYER